MHDSVVLIFFFLQTLYSINMICPILKGLKNDILPGQTSITVQVYELFSVARPEVPNHDLKTEQIV